MSPLPVFEILPFASLVVPLLFLLSAFVSRRAPAAFAWRWTKTTALVALLVSAVLLVSVLALSPASTRALSSLGFVHVMPLGVVLQVLASFIGFIVVSYSHNSLGREAGAQRYLLWLQLTLAAVGAAVVSNHLLVLFAAWTCISHSLHQLLMFYPERPRAALAAHKKFLLARLAELSLLGAFLLLHQVHDTWLISEILAAYPAVELGAAEQAAALLLAVAALVKCAQLPVHGWLIQVVEAPTPVSALLHGGVINLGGFLLILFGPLLLQAVWAQWLVLLVAGLTVVIAALIMMTRVSVKVRLAWSTSAQMGLMLVECALGLFELALLHLLAHSCYKAHAFLRAGYAVQADWQQRLAPAEPPTLGQVVEAILLAAVAVASVVWLADYVGFAVFAGVFSPWWLLVLALATLLVRRRSHLAAGSLLQWTLPLLLTLAAYVLLKHALHLGLPAPTAVAGIAADLWLIALFSLLFAGYYLQTYYAHLPWVARCNLYLYAGLYLDEWLTRATLTLWPARLPVRMNAKRSRLIEGEI